jgi:NadR type nicotinamide-nucleotide adenylyltransferase
MEKQYVPGMTANHKTPAIIVVTGAESTGKSVLAMQLGTFFNVPFYPEYAREYLERSGPGYTFQDVETIARVQEEQMREAAGRDTRYVFFDTWLIITKVWFEVVYGKVPGWILKTLATAPVHLFLLCANDIPWIPDPLRENGGDMREKLFERYKTNLEDFGFNYQIVTGTGEDRMHNAIRIIHNSV